MYLDFSQSRSIQLIKHWLLFQFDSCALNQQPCLRTQLALFYTCNLYLSTLLLPLRSQAGAIYRAVHLIDVIDHRFVTTLTSYTNWTAGQDTRNDPSTHYNISYHQHQKHRGYEQDRVVTPSLSLERCGTISPRTIVEPHTSAFAAFPQGEYLETTYI